MGPAIVQKIAERSSYDPIVVVMVVALVYIAVELVKHMGYRKNRKVAAEVRTTGFTAGDREFLHGLKVNEKAYKEVIDSIAKRVERLDDLHSIKDADGVPLWYVPRSLIELEKETLAAINRVSNVQSSTLEATERVINAVEALEDKIKI